MVTPSAPVNRQIARIEAVREGLAAFNDFVVAGAEILAGQIGGQTELRGDKSISRQAGELLVEVGVAANVDEGIIIFHERIGRANPALRRTLARIDRRAGRLPKVKRSPAQRAMAQAVRAGLVVRNKKTGRISRLNDRGRREVSRVKRIEDKKRRDRVKRLQGTALKKLRGIGG